MPYSPPQLRCVERMRTRQSLLTIGLFAFLAVALLSTASGQFATGQSTTPLRPSLRLFADVLQSQRFV
jgi:hypothetical protein